MSAPVGDSATHVSAGEALTPERLLDAGARATEPVAQYALRLGDDALIFAQRSTWWISRSPEIEEDVALGNIALDVLGHARMLLTYAGTAWDRTEDDLAYFRDAEELRCAQLVELDVTDFGILIARNLVMAAYWDALYAALTTSTDVSLAGIAAKASKELGYHLDHASLWTVRLGDGSEESHARMQDALEAVWPYVEELFEDEPLHDELDGIAVRPSTLRDEAIGRIRAVIEQATLTVPEVPPARTGGRKGLHTEALGTVLAEMQVLARRHPGATW